MIGRFSKLVITEYGRVFLTMKHNQNVKLTIKRADKTLNFLLWMVIVSTVIFQEFL